MRRGACAVLLGLAIAVIGCTADSSVPSAQVSDTTAADLTVQALSIACGATCMEKDLFVYESLVGDLSSLGAVEPMPQAVVEALEGMYPAVTWVDTHVPLDAVSLSDRREAVLITLGPLRPLADEVVGVNVGVSYGAFHGQTVQFRFEGGKWLPADADSTGVTVTSLVS